MAQQPSPLDLTTTTAVQNWLISQGSVPNDTELDSLQAAVTAFSIYVLRMTGRASQDGSLPSLSPFNTPCSYSETYDGNGAPRLLLRNWPINSVSSVAINAVSIPQSTAPNVQGWVVDANGKFLALRNGYGNSSGGLLVNTFQSLFYYRGWGGFGGGSLGFNQGIQNVQVSYIAGFSSTPGDLEFAARRTVAKNYKQRPHIGMKSESMAGGAGTLTFDWDMLAEDWGTIMYYKRSASVP